MLLLHCGRWEKNTLKHQDPQMKANTWRAQKAGNSILILSRTPTRPPGPPSWGHISILSRANLFIWCCIFLFCPLEEIPQLALKILMPQLLPASHPVDKAKKPHTPFSSVRSRVCANAIGVCVCVRALHELELYTDAWCAGEKKCMLACWCLY